MSNTPPCSENQSPPSLLLNSTSTPTSAQPVDQVGHPNHSYAQLSAQFQSLQFAQGPFLSPHSVTNTPHVAPAESPPIYSLPSQQPIDGSAGIPRYPLPPAHTHASIPQGPIYYGQGMFSGSHNFSLYGGTFIDNGTTSGSFMKELLQHTLIGAEFDSSDRDPPPRCHPGTRLAILQRCLDFIDQCHDEEKMRWVVGPAGVGKSAVVQIVAEKVPEGIIVASIFLSVNGRQDGSKTIVTIAYQFAVKCEPYRHFIRDEIAKDPSLARKALSVQFQKFIVEPFVHRRLFDSSRRFLVLIDGLDECDNLFTQQELLRLISNFCLSSPTSPIAWIVASRPEPHITSFFDDTKVASVYTKEEMVVDSEEASEDVQRYLRDELNKIKLAYPTLQRKRQWPSEHQFTKIATAASGLFAYASTVVRYIGDPLYGDPAAQLDDVLAAIDGGPMDDTSGADGPLAQLDILYGRILSRIPEKVMINTRRLLLLSLGSDWSGEPLRMQCNLLGFTEDATYGAIRHLYSVVKISDPEKADDEPIEFIHKSFKDYLHSFERSGFAKYVYTASRELASQAALRIAQEVHAFEAGADGVMSCGATGDLKGDSSICNVIALSWPGDERFAMTDEELRFKLYTDSMDYLSSNFRNFQDMFTFQLLTTRFASPGYFFPYDELRSCAFGELRSELMELGKFKQVPLRALDYAAIWGEIDFRFTSPVDKNIPLSYPFNASCRHGNWTVNDSQQTHQSTLFYRWGVKASPRDPVDIPRFSVTSFSKTHSQCFSFYSSNCVRCSFCLQRLARYIMNNPDQMVTVFIDSTEMCFVEMSFVDPEDGVSQWRYQFLHSGLPACGVA